MKRCTSHSGGWLDSYSLRANVQGQCHVKTYQRLYVKLAVCRYWRIIWWKTVNKEEIGHKSRKQFSPYPSRYPSGLIYRYSKYYWVFCINSKIITIAQKHVVCKFFRCSSDEKISCHETSSTHSSVKQLSCIDRHLYYIMSCDDHYVTQRHFYMCAGLFISRSETTNIILLQLNLYCVIPVSPIIAS